MKKSECPISIFLNLYTVGGGSLETPYSVRSWKSVGNISRRSLTVENEKDRFDRFEKDRFVSVG